MGSEDDPEDGSAVAGAVFGAVGIYGVSLIYTEDLFRAPSLTSLTDLPCILRQPGILTSKREETRRHCTFVTANLKRAYPGKLGGKHSIDGLIPKSVLRYHTIIIHTTTISSIITSRLRQRRLLVSVFGS